MSDPMFLFMIMAPLAMIIIMVGGFIYYERQMARMMNLLREIQGAWVDYRSAVERMRSTHAPCWEDAQEARADLVVAEQRLRRLVG